MAGGPIGVHGIGNPELAKPTVELPPFDREFVQCGKQKVDDDLVGSPVCRKARFFKKPAAWDRDLRIDSGQFRQGTYRLDRKAQPLRGVVAGGDATAGRYGKNQGKNEHDNKVQHQRRTARPGFSTSSHGRPYCERVRTLSQAKGGFR